MLLRKEIKILGLLGSVALFTTLSYGATIQGTVKGPDGAPFQDAFVGAQNAKTKKALSDGQGHYRLENLPAGEYRVQIKAVGYRSDPRTGVNLTADQKASFDFALQKGTVHWSDLSISQARKLLPDAKGKTIFFANCSVCH